jgi:Zn-dependent M16 (insulinase) family peptidase
MMKKRIFEQEGWHYELEKNDGELKINGVVYNEMKGVMSSPDDVLERSVYASLFPAHDLCRGIGRRSGKHSGSHL